MEPDKPKTISVRAPAAVIRASPSQSIILKAGFDKNNVASSTELEALSTETGLPKKWIAAWFVRQRSKIRKARASLAGSTCANTSCSSTMDNKEIAAVKTEISDANVPVENAPVVRVLVKKSAKKSENPLPKRPYRKKKTNNAAKPPADGGASKVRMALEDIQIKCEMPANLNLRYTPPVLDPKANIQTGYTSTAASSAGQVMGSLEAPRTAYAQDPKDQTQGAYMHYTFVPSGVPAPQGAPTTPPQRTLDTSAGAPGLNYSYVKVPDGLFTAGEAPGPFHTRFKYYVPDPPAFVDDLFTAGYYSNRPHGGGSGAAPPAGESSMPRRLSISEYGQISAASPAFVPWPAPPLEMDPVPSQSIGHAHMMSVFRAREEMREQGSHHPGHATQGQPMNLFHPVASAATDAHYMQERNVDPRHDATAFQSNAAFVHAQHEYHHHSTSAVYTDVHHPCGVQSMVHPLHFPQHSTSSHFPTGAGQPPGASLMPTLTSVFPTFLDATRAPLKHLTDVVEPFVDRIGGYYGLMELEDDQRGELMARLLDVEMGGRDPFKAAMGLALATKLGLEWAQNA